MSIPPDDLGSMLKAAVEPQAQMDLAATTAMPIDPSSGMDAPPPAPPPDQVAEPDTSLPAQPIQVAGVGSDLIRQLMTRTAEAEKRVLPKLADKPIQFIGKTNEKMLIRPMEQDEIDRLGTAFGGQ